MILQPPDLHYLNAAKGWCDFHDYQEAYRELQQLSPRLNAHPDVLEVRWQIYINLEQLEKSLDAAETMVELYPENAAGWVYKSNSLSELDRTQQAYDTLWEAAKRFPGNEMVHYDMACVCFAMKKVDEARKHLSIAIELGGDVVKLKALDDEDLKGLLDS